MFKSNYDIFIAKIIKIERREKAIFKVIQLLKGDLYKVGKETWDTPLNSPYWICLSKTNAIRTKCSQCQNH